ncbi:family 20 glycosylhydrolase [Flavihumibacter profundi]|jgi:hexosaminidase|uniref:family 20 glycosylhydrolase n=1 Tax=Flavihumibacter profundi TaxID=2716883 RepID=UPI001CC69FA7|nr:family 20 glycosylhydrolase [Flavihumibacter profundi]MBZ5855512.1 beta-N-acetylhexosaminidase [Flavihumibacter profundi]
MKRLLKVLKIIALSILALLLLSAIGLLLFYQSIYTETPLPPKTVSKVTLNTSYKSDKPILLPVPQSVEWTDKHFTFPAIIRFNAPAEDVEIIRKICMNHLNTNAEANTSGSIKFIKNKALETQAYYLSVQPGQIKIEYNSQEGLFYALTTLKQLAKQSNNQLPCVEIKDKPDLQVRGALLDISRGKIPTLQTLYSIVDFLSDLKYNQLQLYIEGFPFAYPSFKNLWEKTETPLTPEEIRQLDAYCRDRFIELVPNQNSLGHMDAWLAKEEYRSLAECPEGYKLLGLIETKSTLSPTNPKSLELVKKMSEDLLPNFTSTQFNVNLDEPFELGKSKEHPASPQEVGKMYLNYVKQLNSYVNSKGKTMMMWGDVLTNNPEIIPEIPKNITLLEWGYEAVHPFNKYCARNQKAGFKYMVCPGTNTWTSFTGRTNDMMGNVENAVGNGIKYGATGMLMTDWGNTPHLQYLTVSYAGLAYAAALSWNFESKNQVALGDYLSKAVFKDTTGRMGNLVLEAGRYNQFEEYPMLAMTTTGMSYLFGFMDKTMMDAISRKMQKGIFEFITDVDYKQFYLKGFKNPKVYNASAILNFVDTLEQQLLVTHLQTPESNLVLDEYKNGLRMVKLGARLKQYNNYHLQQADSINKIILTEMKLLCPAILQEHERLWMNRNKKSGLDQSMESIKKLQVQIDKELELLNKNGITRWLHRTGEKLISAAAVLYFRS